MKLGLGPSVVRVARVSGPRYYAPISPGVVSSADPDTLQDAVLTGGDLWNYFIDFDGAGTRGRIKLQVSDDGGLTWGTPSVIADLSEEATPLNIETPTVIYDGVSVSIYALVYETSNIDAANFIAIWDATETPSYIGAVLNSGDITADTGYVMEPEAIVNGVDRDIFYTGADVATGDAGLSICYATSTDGFTWSGKTALLRSNNAPAGAFYHGGASPSVVQLPDDTWLMCFTGIDVSFANAGGLTFARTSGSDPATGWSFGTKAVIVPHTVAGQTVTLVTGADMSHDSASDLLTIRYSALVGAEIKMGTAEISLSLALTLAGL